MANNRTWYVTGASKGLGLSLVKLLLAKGERVAATSRSKSALLKAVAAAREAQFLPLETDLTSESSIRESIAATIERFGSLDVIVNNAGYGIGGTIEELSNQEIHQNFDINVFATIAVIREAMPQMRKQGSGHIINISSIAGFAAASGWGMYAAAKYAVMGLSEVLADDVRSLGIKVTVVAPGAFRTQFLSGDSLAFAANPIADYKDVRASHERYLAMDGKQAGDPDKAAQAFIDLVNDPNPPVRLYLGSDAYERATAKINLLTEELKQWKAVSASTGYPKDGSLE